MILFQYVRALSVPLFLWLLLLLSAGQGEAATQPNGLFLENAVPPAAQGVVYVLGVADHPTFRKWQLDMLLEGAGEVFVAFGETKLSVPTRLAEIDPRLYPQGEHQLRLRVVHSNLNYDEYFLPFPITLSKTGAPASLPAAQPAPSVVISPPPALPAGNGIAVTSRNGLLAVEGVADHPAFRKWQVDLLLAGDADQSVFLAVGEERVTRPRELVTFDPADYPAGEHRLRLRVVHSNLNYDEYLLPLVIGAGRGVTPATATGERSKLLVRSSAEGKAIYLTFDDGPHPRNTPQILEVLAEYNAKATFFVVGSQAQGRGQLLKEMYDSGHALANHSWSHRKLGNAAWEIFEEEVSATAQILGGYGSRCLRPPYGDVGSNLIANAQEAGYTLVYWSVDSLDWKSQAADAITEEVLRHAKPGAIVLLHDGGGSRAGTVAALRTILATLTAEGYTFPALCR